MLVSKVSSTPGGIGDRVGNYSAFTDVCLGLGVCLCFCFLTIDTELSTCRKSFSEKYLIITNKIDNNVQCQQYLVFEYTCVN